MSQGDYKSEFRFHPGTLMDAAKRFRQSDDAFENYLAWEIEEALKGSGFDTLGVDSDE